MQPWCPPYQMSVFDSVDGQLLERQDFFNLMSPELSSFQTDEQKMQYGIIIGTPSTVNYQGSLGALKRQLIFNQNSNDSQEQAFQSASLYTSLENLGDSQFQPQGQQFDEVSEEYVTSSEKKFKFRFNLEGSSRDQMDLNSHMIQLAPIFKRKNRSPVPPSDNCESGAIDDPSLPQKIINCRFCLMTFDRNCSLGGHVSKVHSGKSEGYKKKTLIKTIRNQQRTSAKLVRKYIELMFQENFDYLI